jgi:uncharacterized protein
LVGAPSIWWDNRSLLTHIARLREKQSRLNAELFIGVGEDETPSMLGDLELFDRQLATRPFAGLSVTTQRFAGRDHYNLLPDLFRDGFHFLFGERGRGPWSEPNRSSQLTAKSTRITKTRP